MASEFDDRFEAKKRGEHIEEEPLAGKPTAELHGFSLWGTDVFFSRVPEGTYANSGFRVGPVPSFRSNLRINPIGPNGKRAITVEAEEVVDLPLLPPAEQSP